MEDMIDARLWHKLWNTINSGQILIDGEARVILWNDWMVNHSGISAELALGHTLEALFSDRLSTPFKVALRNALLYRSPIILSNALHRAPLPLYAQAFPPASEMRIEQSITLTPVFDGERRFCLIQVSDSSVSVGRERLLHKQSERLSKEAATDGLTALYNRRFFDENLKLEFVRAQRHKYPLTLLMLDVDCFKEYNDTYGHASGDATLRAIANALRVNIGRESDIVARYGGEEFVVILPDCNSTFGQLIAEKIRAAIAQLNIKHATSKVSEHVTVSVGMATLSPGPNCLPSALFEMADQMLYEAKRAGRNVVKHCV